MYLLTFVLRRSMHLAIGAVSLPGLFVTYWAIPESVRWLTCNGKLRQANVVLQVTFISTIKYLY